MSAVPVISVIVPVYNQEALVARCIESILLQSFADFELILIDDGSTDNSGILCDEWSLKDSRIRSFHQQNSGVSVARNMGIEQAKGIYIVFVDSDDWVRKDYLDCLLKDALGNGKRGLVIQGFLSYAPDGSRRNDEKCFVSVSSDSYANIGEMIEQYDLGECGFTVSKLYNRSLIMQYGIRFEKHISFCEDLLFMYDYLLRADYLVLGKAQEYVYIRYPSSLSTRLHAFDMEYNCFLECRKRVWKLSEYFNISLQMLPKTITAMMKCFQRALKTDYQSYHKKDVSMKERLKHLKKLVKTNKESIRRFYQPVCKSDRVGKLFLEADYLVLYDIYIRFLFRLKFIPIFWGPVKKR